MSIFKRTYPFQIKFRSGYYRHRAILPLIVLAGILSTFARAQDRSVFVPYSNKTPEEDAYIDFDCSTRQSSNKAISGLETTEFEQGLFFTHTPPNVRKWLGNKSLIEARAHVVKVGKNTFLVLHFVINSEKAKSSYGDLEKGAMAKVFLEDDTELILYNLDRDKGQVRRQSKETVYEGTYNLDKFEVKELKKKDIYKISIVWEEGIESYNVFNINLIRNQLQCLEKMKK